MLGVLLTTDERQVRALQREFNDVPNVLDRVVPPALNRSVEKTRQDIVNRLAAANPGLTRPDIHKATKTKKASPSDWSGQVEMSGHGVPVANLDVRLGGKTEVTSIASEKQSAWLFHNIFKPKYGAAAVYSTAYRIARKVYQNITYRVSGQTKSLAGTGAFPIPKRFGRMGIFERRKGFGGMKEKIREIRGPSLFRILDENTVMMRDITREATRGFERELEKLNERHELLIPRQPLRLFPRQSLTELGVVE